jgi:hypothetical protein
MLFTSNLSPLQSSKFSFEYLLLSPRSALGHVPAGLAPWAFATSPTPSYSSEPTSLPLMAMYKPSASAPSIFRANSFGR